MMMGGLFGQMGNDDAVTADSFQGGLEDLQSALMESNQMEIDELTGMKQQRQAANMQGANQQDQMMMMLMQALGGGM